jgi:membrane-associated PAP2 superfamily phosphatase
MDSLFKVEKFKAKRWLYGYMFWVSMLCTCVIGLMKAQSAHACPWDMTQQTTTGFVWDFQLNGWTLFSWWTCQYRLCTGHRFFVYRFDKKTSMVLFICRLYFGFAMGWAQMMRGAHFLSHNLWTGGFV